MQRDVIKWLQTLDLSFAVKNPRRDLCNGFVVAEILSRYDKDISMHSFDTGASMVRRVDNWNQIQKILVRRGCKTINEQMVEGATQAKGNFANEVLNHLFEHLTTKKLTGCKLPVDLTSKAIIEAPAYSRPTAAFILHEENDATATRLQNITGRKNEDKIRNRNVELLRTYGELQQAVKLSNPDRFLTKALGAPKKKTPEKLPKSKPSTNIQVQVRTIDSSVLVTLQLREELGREQAAVHGFNKFEDLATALSAVVSKQFASCGISDDVDASCPEHRHGDQLTKFIMLRLRLSDQVKNLIWDVLVVMAKNTAKHIAMRMSEFHHLILSFGFCFSKEVALVKSFNTPTTVDVLRAFEFFTAVGKSLVAISADAALRAANDHLIPNIVQCISFGQSAALQKIAAVVAAYVHPSHLDGVVSVTRTLSKYLSDTPAADNLLIFVAHLCSNFVDCPGIMQELIIPWGMKGLSSCSSICRAAGMYLMSLIHSFASPAEEGQVLGLALNAAVDDYWEVKINALEFLARMHFDMARSSEDTAPHPLLQRVQNTLDTVFNSLGELAPRPQRLLSLLAVGKYIVPDVHTSLARSFILRLGNECSAADRQCLLDPREPHIAEVQGRVRWYRNTNLISVVVPVITSSVLAVFFKEMSSSSVLQILRSLVIAEDVGAAHKQAWQTNLRILKAEIISSIVDRTHCRGAPDELNACSMMAYSICTKVHSDLSEEALHPNLTPEEVQEAAVDWVSEKM